MSDTIPAQNMCAGRTRSFSVSFTRLRLSDMIELLFRRF